MGPHVLTTWQPWALGAGFPDTEVVLLPHGVLLTPALVGPPAPGLAGAQVRVNRRNRGP